MASVVNFHCMDSLRSVEQIELLDLVDSLRAEGLSEFTALPQLIVCGDQSSVKSSLLEAISGVPFPKKDNLCTRFATEVILRRAFDTEIKVSLVCSYTPRSLHYSNYDRCPGAVDHQRIKSDSDNFAVRSPPWKTSPASLNRLKMPWGSCLLVAMLLRKIYYEWRYLAQNSLS